MTLNIWGDFQICISVPLKRGGHNNNQYCPDADALTDVLAEYMFGNI